MVRPIIITAVRIFLVMLIGGSVFAESMPTVEVYKNEQCGCCNGWVEHMRKNGFNVKTNDVVYVTAINNKFGIPNNISSCHTAKVGNYVIVGHVPAEDIKRLLGEKPHAIGLAVPEMPAGSPGMESAKPVAYDTLLIQENGSTKVYAHHGK